MTSRFDLLVVALMAAIIGSQLLVPPIVGLANNGDYERLKHLFLFNVLVDLVLVAALTWAAAWLLRVARRDRSAVNQEV